MIKLPLCQFCDLPAEFVCANIHCETDPFLCQSQCLRNASKWAHKHSPSEEGVVQLRHLNDKIDFLKEGPFHIDYDVFDETMSAIKKVFDEFRNMVAKQNHACLSKGFKDTIRALEDRSSQITGKQINDIMTNTNIYKKNQKIESEFKYQKDRIFELQKAINKLISLYYQGKKIDSNLFQSSGDRLVRDSRLKQCVNPQNDLIIDKKQDQLKNDVLFQQQESHFISTNISRIIKLKKSHQKNEQSQSQLQSDIKCLCSVQQQNISNDILQKDLDLDELFQRAVSKFQHALYNQSLKDLDLGFELIKSVLQRNSQDFDNSIVDKLDRHYQLLDLCFKNLFPQVYMDIRKRLKNTRRRQSTTQIISRIRKQMFQHYEMIERQWRDQEIETLLHQLKNLSNESCWFQQ